MASRREGSAMAIGTPHPRRQIHTRQIIGRGYVRDDGLFDIEADLIDHKPFVYEDRERGEMQPGAPIHQMRVRVTVDNDLVVRDIECEMPDVPFDHCHGALGSAPSLVSTSVGPGWRRAVDERMRGRKGCTHLRELLYCVGTVAFQTISPYREQFMSELGSPKSGKDGLPFFIDQCFSWSVDSPVVRKYFPIYFQGKDD
ncbi:MAG: DUF2889 domain-containing protein [Burkholderiales bacterium]|mgnify:CR=1 FL=1|nr:DUF2889 domain-containing protein [Burkholderiales bacterium]